MTLFDTIFEVHDRLQDAVRRGTAPALVHLVGGPKLTGLGYWRSPDDAERFEHDVVRHAVGHRQGVFGVPLLTTETDSEIQIAGPVFHGAPINQAVPGVQEMLWLLSFDLDVGYDLHRCLYARRPDGEPIFGELQTLQGGARLADGSPGFTVIRSLLAAA